MSTLFHDAGRPARGQKIMLATTVYENPDAAYTHSIQKSRVALSEQAINAAYLLLSGNCHVDDARNSVVREFLASDCTDLVFLDADVCWEPDSLIRLCRYSADVVGGVYPFRRDDLASRDNMPVITIPGVVEPDSDGLLEVAGLPTGFMRIRRHVLESLARDAKRFRGRHAQQGDTPIVFERTLEGGTRWGGDLAFCNKWRGAGGKLHAAVDLHLGHVAKTIVRDSLAAALRRQGRATLAYMADRIRAGTEDAELFSEARRYMGNEYAALEDVLWSCTALARRASGPIVETGSGLTTIAMAAATEHPVYCIEHDERWALHLQSMAKEAGVDGVGLCLCPIVDGWYDLSAFPDLPDSFALGLNDGPPRLLGSRMGFFEKLGERCDVIVADDADDSGYAAAISEWCGNLGRKVDFIEAGRAAIIRCEDQEMRHAG